MSLMNMRNNTGPKTEPCGTPLQTGLQVDCSPLIHTLCFLLLSQFLIQVRT